MWDKLVNRPMQPIGELLANDDKLDPAFQFPPAYPAFKPPPAGADTRLRPGLTHDSDSEPVYDEWDRFVDEDSDTRRNREAREADRATKAKKSRKAEETKEAKNASKEARRARRGARRA